MEKIIINDNHGLEAFLREKEPFLFEDTEVKGEIQRNVILAGFPGTGKSYAGEVLPDKCLDCESSFWHWNTEWLCDKSQHTQRSTDSFQRKRIYFLYCSSS